MEKPTADIQQLVAEINVLDEEISALDTTKAKGVQEDPMKKTKKMIKDIIKLIKEAHQEVEQKDFCDGEMATNEQKRTEKTEAVETSKVNIDELTVSIAQLTKKIAELTKQVAGTAAAVSKTTDIRKTEKVKNAATVKDAPEAQTAVAQALGVLKEFYDKAAKATSFVQVKEPEIFDDTPYKKMAAENGSVLGMIEVIQSDFARLESETTAAEPEGQKEYDQFVAEWAHEEYETGGSGRREDRRDDGHAQRLEDPGRVRASGKESGPAPLEYRVLGEANQSRNT